LRSFSSCGRLYNSQKRAPAQMGMSRGLEVTFGEPEGVGKTWQKPRCSWLGRIPAAQNVNGAGVAPAGPRSAERALCETATRRGDLELGWERLCRARLVLCGDGLGPTRQKPVRKPQHHYAPRPDAGASTGRGFKRWVPMPIRFWASCWRQPSCTSFLFISRFPGSVA